MKGIKGLIIYLLAIPKSLYVCMRLCSFRDAIKLPIVVSHKTRLVNLQGRATFQKIKTAGVRIGFGSVETYDFATERTLLCVSGKIHFEGKCKIGKASRISVSGTFIAGENFHISAAGTIIVREALTIGKNSLMAWESLITDADHHHLLDAQGSVTNPPNPIIIGDHVWIGARSMILKGAHIPHDSVIGANSLVTGKFEEVASLIAGNPAKIVRTSISWSE